MAPGTLILVNHPIPSSPATGSLQDKVCLITGGTRGIGAATALACAQAGARLALVARRTDEIAETLRADIRRIGRECLLISADLMQPKEAQKCVDRTVEHFGGVDIVVHSAGGPVPGGLLELTPEAWYAAFDVHLHAIFHLCRASVPWMKQRGGGAILLISSAAGIRGIKTNLAYQAVKGALPQLTRALAYELADDQIRVNCVAPGIIRTDFHQAMRREVQQFNVEKRIPLHREGTPEQVASLIRELLTNDYITGETVSIDGGLTMRIC